MSFYQNNSSYSVSNIGAIFFLWALYVCFYLFLKSVPSTTLLSGYLPLIGEVGLDFLLVFMLFNLWSRADISSNKKLFQLFFLSSLAAIFTDGIYNVVINIYGLSDLNPIVICLFELPFLLFLFFQALAWCYILYINEDLAEFKIIHYVPFFSASFLMFILFMFGVKWQIEYFSLTGWFKLIDTFFEVVGFFVVTFCLARAQNPLIKFAGTGYLLILASDFIIRFHVISGEIPYLSVFESTWVLGLLLMSLGFVLIKDCNDEKLAKLLPINSIQTQMCIWILVLWLISVLILVGSSYFFSLESEFYLNSITQNFLSMLIPCSVLVIISSSYIAAKISSPLIKLESKINEFLFTVPYSKDLFNLPNPAHLSEFKALEDFIFRSFFIFKQRHLAEVTFAKVATQVSHDIRSPLAAINTVLAITVLPENKRLMIKNASKRINDIADNLLLNSKDLNLNKRINECEIDEHGSAKPEKISTILKDIVDGKRYEYYQTNVNFHLEIAENCLDFYSIIHVASFSRVLSNLLNNSIDSLNGEGIISISLEIQPGNIEICIEDNGCGIPSDVMNQITEEGFSFNKKNGAGLGLFYANKYINKIHGKLLIESQENIGTRVLISLPRY